MREVVVLKRCRGWTLPQISERIGRTVLAVASLLRRGLEGLRKRTKSEAPQISSTLAGSAIALKRWIE